MSSDEVVFEPWTKYWSIFDTSTLRTAYVLCPGMGSVGEKDLCLTFDEIAKLIRFGYAHKGLSNTFSLIKNSHALASNRPRGMSRMDRIVRLTALIKNLVMDQQYEYVYLIGFSHGALLLHAAYLHLLIGVTKNEDVQKIKHKLRLVTVGAPRYVDPAVFGHTYESNPRSAAPMPPPVLNIYYYNDLVLRLNAKYNGIVKFATPDFKKYDKPAELWERGLRAVRHDLNPQPPTQQEKVSILGVIGAIAEAIKRRIYNIPIFKAKPLELVKEALPEIPYHWPTDPNKYMSYTAKDGIAVCLSQYAGKHPAETHIIIQLLDCVFGKKFVTVMYLLPDDDPKKENTPYTRYTELEITNTSITPGTCISYSSALNFKEGGGSKRLYERTSERRRCSDGKVRTVYKKGSRSYVKRRTQNGSYKYEVARFA